MKSAQKNPRNRIKIRLFMGRFTGDQEICARFSNQKKNMKAANKYYEIWRVFSKFSLAFKNLYGIK
jgi:hypothetical protein